MGKAEYRQLADGLTARVAPVWSEEKLMILEAYLKAFAKACTKVGGWYALDLFAGSGGNWSQVREVERLSSPQIALQAGEPKAVKVVAAESAGRLHSALEARTEAYGDRIVLFKEDANRAVDRMLRAIPVKAPTFAFLDPEGSELDWQTVHAIADHKRGHSRTKIEQLILFPTDTGFMRLAPERPEYVTRIFGNEDWMEIYERRVANKLSPDQARGLYVQLYGRGLRRLGYDVVLDRQITKDNGQPMYFLIFATDHSAGERIMDHCFNQVRVRVAEELGQGQLFTLPEAPRRKRLDEG
jgi:three-Cys-motif partner protein